jgi:hypothetical protein
MPRRRGRKRRTATKLHLPLPAVFLCFAALASVGWLSRHQFLAPIIVVIGAGATASLALYLRRRVIANRRYRDLSRLQLLSPIEFERHVAGFYRRSGFRVKLTKITGDQGIDVIADGKDGRIGIQVKQYSGAVGNDAVQEVVAGLAFHRCSRGVVITTSRFTPAAKALARANNVELVDGVTYVARVARQLRLPAGNGQLKLNLKRSSQTEPLRVLDVLSRISRVLRDGS